MKLKLLALILAAMLVGCAAQPFSVAPPPAHSMAQPNSIPSAQLPQQGFTRIISVGPNIAEILVAVGAGEYIVAADELSGDVSGLREDIIFFSDFFGLDAERLVALHPDIVFVMGMMRAGDDPFAVLEGAGIRVVEVPTAQSFDDIKRDIAYIAEVLQEHGNTGAGTLAQSIIADMEYEIKQVRAIAENFERPLLVYFEIEAAPHMFSFGQGTFLNEMIEIAGGANVFADRQGWLGVSAEYVLAAAPDIIFTNVAWLDDPVAEILARPGWQAIPAVASGRVYYISANPSSRPSHKVTQALWQMASALHQLEPQSGGVAQ